MWDVEVGELTRWDLAVQVERAGNDIKDSSQVYSTCHVLRIYVWTGLKSAFPHHAEREAVGDTTLILHDFAAYRYQLNASFCNFEHRFGQIWRLRRIFWIILPASPSCVWIPHLGGDSLEQRSQSHLMCRPGLKILKESERPNVSVGSAESWMVTACGIECFQPHPFLPENS